MFPLTPLPIHVSVLAFSWDMKVRTTTNALTYSFSLQKELSCFLPCLVSINRGASQTDSSLVYRINTAFHPSAFFRRKTKKLESLICSYTITGAKKCKV